MAIDAVGFTRMTPRYFNLDRVRPVSMLCPGMQALTLGEKIRNLREANRLSLRELGRRADVSPSFLSGIEGGSRYPSVPALERLAEQLVVSSAGLRSLDNRSSLTKLRLILESEPSWGLAFKELAAAAETGKVAPEDLLKWLESGK